MKTYNKTVVAAQALNASFNSAYQPLKNMVMYSMSAIVTGTPTGTVKLQASNDPETNDTQVNSTGLPPAVAPSNWVDINNSSFSLTSSGESLWNVTEVAYNYVRVVYTDTSGGSSTAHMKIIMNGKGI